MKPVHYLATYILFCHCFFSSSALLAQIPTNGLVAHWPFSGNANDAHGTHHGNPANVTLTQGKMGFNNTAYLFNSVNDYIGVPYQNDMNLPTISICVIFRPDSFYKGACQGNYILSRGVGRLFRFLHSLLL